MDHHRAHLALTPHALTSSPNKGRAHRMTDSLFRRKPIVPERREGEQALVRTLGWPHLVALGVGAIVGTGILTLIGVGADKAGPAVSLSIDRMRGGDGTRWSFVGSIGGRR